MNFKIKEFFREENGSYNFTLANKVKYTNNEKEKIIKEYLEIHRKIFTYDDKNFSISFHKENNIFKFKIHKEDNPFNVIMFPSCHQAQNLIEEIQIELKKEFEIQMIIYDFEFIDKDIIKINDNSVFINVGPLNGVNMVYFEELDIYELPTE